MNIDIYKTIYEASIQRTLRVERSATRLEASTPLADHIVSMHDSKGNLFVTLMVLGSMYDTRPLEDRKFRPGDLQVLHSAWEDDGVWVRYMYPVLNKASHGFNIELGICEFQGFMMTEYEQLPYTSNETDFKDFA